MSLHIEVTGNGEPLVLLHGWGMHGGIWRDLAAQFSQNFEVHCVDLPGYGESLPIAEYTLDSVVECLAAQFDQVITLCGWSLGGQIAMHWAMCEPEKVKRMVLVTSTPCFAERVDWEFGMARATLHQFSVELEKNYKATLRRFLALQVRGSEGERELLSEMREKLFIRGEPDMDALRGGLNILRDADLRDVVRKIKQPTLVIAGERDKLTLSGASYYLAQKLQNARVAEIKGAAHAPFLSHPKIFNEHLKNFLYE